MNLKMGQHALALVILCLVSKADNQFVVGPKPSMSKLDAVRQCSNTGSTLLNYKNIKANPSAQEYMNRLGDGESAWIEGYAKLSPFLSWQGCFTTTDLKKKISFRIVAIGFRSIHKCLQPCYGYRYIGLKDTSCYCISQTQRSEIYQASVNDSFCSIPCFNNAIDSCGGHSYMSVYGILDNGRIHWAANEPSAHLCVYVKRKQLNFEAFTASCHTLQSGLINGYICTTSAWSRLSTTNCSRLTTTQGTYCIMEDTSSRTEASKGCFRKKGMLADIGAERVTPALLNHNFKYWIGIHRTFGIAEAYRDGETFCLSVTRAGNMLHLEPDGCSAQKYYLCESNFKEDTNTLTSTMSLSRKTEKRVPDTNQTSASTTNPPNRGIETNTESPIPYIVPIVLMVIFIILLILFIVYRRHKKRRNQTTRKLNDNYDAIYEADNIINERSFSSDPGQNTDSKCLIVKSKPDKPEHLTLKRRTLTNEYENFTLKGNNKETTAKKKGKRDKDDEYDKLKFNSMLRNIKGGHEESNVYNHMVGTDNDNYDTMKSTKFFHSVGRIDETYSRMNDRLVLNDYCGRQVSAKVHGNIENADNVPYNLKLQQPAPMLEEEQPRRFIIIDAIDLSTEMNDTKPEDQECNENINYTEIAHSPENIEYTVIAGATCESNNEDKINFKEFELDNTDEKSEIVKVNSDKKNINAIGTPFIDKLDATYASVKKGSKERKNVEDFKMHLNYVQVNLPETDS